MVHGHFHGHYWDETCCHNYPHWGACDKHEVKSEVIVTIELRNTKPVPFSPGITTIRRTDEMTMSTLSEYAPEDGWVIEKIKIGTII